MNTVTDEKKIMTAQAQSKLNEKYFDCKNEFINAEFKHWTSGKERKPIKDEIIVHEPDGKSYVLFGIEYDDQGNAGMIYKTDTKGKRINLNISANAPTKGDVISKRLEDAKKEVKTPAKEVAKTEKKVTKAARKTVTSTKAMQIEQRS